MSRVKALLIAVDQFFNALFGGWPDETLSSRIHRGAVLSPKPRRRWLIARHIVNKLFWWQPDHCRGAYKMEQQRRHLPRVFQQ